MIHDCIQSTHHQLLQLQVASLQQIKAISTPLAQYSGNLEQQLATLRGFLYTFLYRHPHVYRQIYRARGVLEQLFAAYLADPLLLPFTVQQAAQAEGLPRAVCDYLAGMTDRFAMEEHARLFDARLH